MKWFWQFSKMKRRAQERGYVMTMKYQKELLTNERKTKKGQWVHRYLIRLDRIICGCPPFKQRKNHYLELCNDYWGLV